MPRYYAEAEKTTDELEQMFIDEISMQKDIRIISLMQTLGHKALNIVKRNATADVQEVKHGKWELSVEPLGMKDVDCVKCSLCGELFIVDEDYDFDYIKEFFIYCPHCGAKMDEKSKSDNVIEKVYCKDCQFLETESGGYACCGKAVKGIVKPWEFCNKGINK